MRIPLLYIFYYLGIFLGVEIFIALFDAQYLNAPLLLLIVMRLIASRYLARGLAIVVGLIVEMNSPFPGLSLGISILAAYFFMDIYALRFVSRQTFLGVFICGLLTIIVAHGTLILLNVLGIGSSAEWVPSPDFAHWFNFFKRGILTVLIAAGITVLGVRLYSPRLRGIVIANS